MTDWTGVAQAITAVASLGVAGVSVWVADRSLRASTQSLRLQKRAVDVSSVLTIWQRLDEHWVRFKKAEEDDKSFEFGQLISYYEMSCQLFRNHVLSTEASRSLLEHLQELLPAMQNDQAFATHFSILKSRPETFENIEWLCQGIMDRK